MLNLSLQGYIEVGFLKSYLILGTHTSECSSSLGTSWESNQVPLGWQVRARARLTDTKLQNVFKLELCQKLNSTIAKLRYGSHGHSASSLDKETPIITKGNMNQYKC